MTEKKRRIFWPWNYSAEEQAVNEASQQGHHMIACSTFFRTEEVDETACYTYSLSAEDKNGLVEALYAKQGWELAVKHWGWRWYRKKHSPETPESAYVFYGPSDRNVIADYLHRIIKPLDIIRNALLVAAVLLLLIPGELTANWTPRIAALPLFLAIPVVKYAESIRKVLGEDKRK